MGGFPQLFEPITKQRIICSLPNSWHTSLVWARYWEVTHFAIVRAGQDQGYGQGAGGCHVVMPTAIQLISSMIMKSRMSFWNELSIRREAVIVLVISKCSWMGVRGMSNSIKWISFASSAVQSKRYKCYIMHLKYLQGLVYRLVYIYIFIWVFMAFSLSFSRGCLYTHYGFMAAFWKSVAAHTSTWFDEWRRSRKV